MEPSHELSWQQNIQRALDAIKGRPCVLCGSGATKPVIVICEGEYAKQAQAPTDGRKRLAFVTICEHCEAHPKYAKRIQDKILTLILRR
jgi:NMD protein affecting ribosome stability and mRNA decay